MQSDQSAAALTRGGAGSAGSHRLSFTDRFLTLWIFLAMAAGLSLGAFAPGFAEQIGRFQFGSTNLLLAAGLILMMFPPLAKVRFGRIPGLLQNRRLTTLSLSLNWVLGPILMFALAWMFLRNHPGLFAGVLLIGIARCIAMVLVWNDLADGDRELGAGLVALNSLFQIAFYSGMAWFFLGWLPGRLGFASTFVSVGFWDVARSVGLYLGVPFLMAVAARGLLIPWRGDEWYTKRFEPAVSPVTPVALLFTIVVMFASQGKAILALPVHLLLVVMPLLLYFGIMFFGSMWASRRLGLAYSEAVAVSFTAAGNNFELAIAVATGLWGITSDQAFAGVVGPLVEVPALILLVRVAYVMRDRAFKLAA